MDFTYTVLEDLLKALKSKGFHFYTLAEYFSNQSVEKPFIILRHDVEARYENALRFAEIQHEMGIRGSYYFRLLPESYNSSVIKRIAALNHEIAYQYDDLSFCHGNHEKAIERFKNNLAHLREFGPVTTISMEGAPLSKWDNRDLWREPHATSHKPQALGSSPYTHYHDFGIIAEPYFDLDFNKIFYLTDTGRRWDGSKVSIRDKAMASRPVTNPEFLGRHYRTTFDIIRAIENNDFPGQAMMTFHPQRWTDRPFPWAKELVFQNIKNVIKRLINNQNPTSRNYEKTDLVDHAFPGDHSDNNLTGRH